MEKGREREAQRGRNEEERVKAKRVEKKGEKSKRAEELQSYRA